MPQGNLSKASHSTKSKHGKQTTLSQQKKHAPTRSTARKFRPGTENVTSAIHKRIEDLMAGRCVHEGGRLKLIKVDAENVDKYVGGGAKVDAKIGRLLQKDAFNRKSRLKRQQAAKPPGAGDASSASSFPKNNSSSKKRKRSHQLDDVEDDDVDPLENIVFSEESDDEGENVDDENGE
jgi:hypothetical protein